LTLTILFVTVGASSGLAQSITELEARGAELEHRMEAAKNALEAREAMALPVTLDTLRMGPFTVLGTEADLVVLVPGAVMAWTMLRSELGADTTLLSRVPITVARHALLPSADARLTRAARSFLNRTDVSGWIPDPQPAVGYGFRFTIPPEDHLIANLRTSLDPDPEESARVLVDAAWSAIATLIPREVVSWAGSDARLSKMTGTRWIYRGVLTSTVRIGVDCLKGSIVRCQDGLGLTPAGQVDAWYDPEDVQRWVVSTDKRIWWSPVLQTTYDRCVESKVIEACREYLRQRYGGYRVPPFDTESRQLALAVAVTTGGEGAIGRLVRSEGSMVERLESVAGVPLDSITVRWRRAVLDASGQSVVLNRATSGFALLWIFVFWALARRGLPWR